MSSSNAPFIYDQTAQQKQTPNTLVFGIPVPSTTKTFNIGDRIQDYTTGAIYEYGLATGAIPQYSPVSYRGNGTTGITEAQSANSTVCFKVKGITQSAINDGEYFFYLVKGPGTVLTNAVGLANGSVLVPDTTLASNVVDLDPGVAYSQTEARQALLPRFIATSAEAGGTVAVIII